MIRTFQEIIEAAKLKERKTIAIACAADEVVLASVKVVENDLGISDCLLIGRKDAILECADRIGYTVKRERIIDVSGDAEAGRIAVSMVNSGEAHLPMKGQMQTPDYLRAVLNKEVGLRGKGALSHVGVFERPEGGLFLLTDCAMTIAPDLNQKIDIISNAVNVARGLGCEKPNVAILSYLEHVNPDVDSSRDAAILSKMAERGQIRNCRIDGPFAFDNALYEEAAKHKGIAGPVAGKADILIVSHIDVGNPLSKSLSMMAGLKFAGLAAGARVPVIMTPRADPMSSKVQSIALCQHILGN